MSADANTPSAGDVELPIDHDSRAFWDGCRERRLMITRCMACGAWLHPPRHMCPRCWSRDVVAEEVSGVGVVYTFVIDATPDARPLGVIELTEQAGLHLTAPIIGCPADAVVIGMAVALTWADYRGVPVPAFEPRGARR